MDEQKIERIAKVCHEANRAYCKTLGDDSQSPWPFIPIWQKDSAINGVRYVLTHLNATPADTHENWFKEKLADGWKYGPKKDPELKQHPCMLAYADLPEEQKRKDALFRSIVLALASDL